jgi:aldehyde:ferredoxin oxidoreductase
VGNTSLQEVDAFTYLGIVINREGGTEEDVKTRTEGKGRIHHASEHMEIMTVKNRDQNKDFQHKCKNCPLVCIRNMENHESNMQETTCVN